MSASLSAMRQQAQQRRAWNTAITQANRVYLPQGAVAMADTGGLPYRRHLATSGLATCVGVFIWAGPGKGLCAHLDQPDDVDIELDTTRFMREISRLFVAFFPGARPADCRSYIRYTSRQRSTVTQVGAVAETLKACGLAVDGAGAPTGDDAWYLDLATGLLAPYSNEGGCGIPEAASADPARVDDRMEHAATTLHGLARGEMFGFRNPQPPYCRLMGPPVSTS